jgi:hypothetical protein
MSKSEQKFEASEYSKSSKKKMTPNGIFSS